ncbi:carboxypeptidase regulatory-like domain-containing protein [Sphingomonas sp.]|uniref:TonB-dependent receptor n=1 Tax=Sphingomonas sp. TaxID=28214 RepID=UPI0035BBF7E9
MRTYQTLRLLLASTALVAAATVAITPAAAQTTTASVRGQVRDAAGAASAGATVVAVSEATNQTFRATADANGNYTLNGVRPGGYTVTFTGANGETYSQVVTVGVAQSATLDADLAAPGAEVSAATGAAGSGTDIVVTAGRLVETRTSEIATNVSQAQIRNLPQTDRNFLSFAALAPGVVYVDSETNKGIQSGASTRAGVNVFIDGVSLKNQVLEGGVAGQQDSRGNPFGQLAVGEFRVLTQNFKAEYEQAGAAIVTAVTKSGTNALHGEAFGQYTGRSLSAKSIFDKRNGNAEPEFKRKQYGVSLGGPIIKDKLFFFGAYEGNDQDRAFTVRLGNRTPDNLARFGRYEGSFVSPFRADFYFGKLTFTPDDRQTFDISYSRRSESDIQGFGNGSTAFEAAENKLNSVDSYLGKWTYTGDSFVNELNLSFVNSDFNPSALNPNLPTQVYDGVVTFGGKDSTRQYVQQVWTGRDDFTYSGVDNHVLKAGVRLGVTDFTINRTDAPAGRYLYRNSNNNTPTFAGDDTDFSFPAEVRLGLGNPRVTASDTQVGLYLQDDWDITSTVQLNLGLRWDYETNPFNNDYVTGGNAAAALRALPKTYYFDPEDYISTGNNRKAFWKAFQPRVGFSWDIKDDQSTVFFGGAGRYYDRNVFNQSLDETFRNQYQAGVFYFSRDGGRRNPSVDANGNVIANTGLPTVVWNNSYLDPTNLAALRASAQTGLPELFANLNDAKLPRTDQFSLGVRQKIGIFQASVTGSYIRGKNGYTYLFATRANNGLGGCCNTGPLQPFGFSNALIGYDGLDTRYKAIYVTLDKNYSQASGWGFNIAYTLSKGEQNGGDLFSLDGITPDDYGWRPRAGDERHRVVLSGLVDLPLGFQFSTLSTLGTGQAYQVFDATDPTKGRVTARYPVKNCIKGVFAFCEVNLTLQNHLRLFDEHEVTFAVDLFNAFNNKNYSGFDGYFNNQINQQTGQVQDPLQRADLTSASSLLTLPRRVQFRVGYRF